MLNLKNTLLLLTAIASIANTNTSSNEPCEKKANLEQCLRYSKNPDFNNKETNIGFSLYNKSNDTVRLQFVRASGVPILPAHGISITSGNIHSTQLDINKPTIISITYGKEKYTYSFRTNKTIYVSWTKPFLRQPKLYPQTGPGEGKFCKTIAGFCKTNNVLKNDISEPRITDAD